MTTNNNNNKLFLAIALGLLLSTLGYYFTVMKPQHDLVQLNADYRTSLMNDLYNAQTLEDSLKILSQEQHAISRPPLAQQIDISLKNYVQTNLKELETAKKDRVAWEKALNTNTVKGFQTYAKSKGKHLAEARDKIEELEEEIEKEKERTKVAFSNVFGSSEPSTSNKPIAISPRIQRDYSTLAKQYAEKAAPYIFTCCSSYPIRKKVRYQSHTVNSANQLIIQMSVKWTSRITTCDVTIYGQLTVDAQGCNPSWTFNKSEKFATCLIKPGCRDYCNDYFEGCL